MKEYKGLSDNEVLASRDKFGENKISQTKSETFFQKYLNSFNDPIITILLIALTINVIFTFFGKVDWFECAGILISVLISTFISTLSEYKNEKNFISLSEASSKTRQKVYRNGILSLINSEDIVTGDIVLIQSGDMIPADGDILEGKITVDQSVINGENVEVEKFCNINYKTDSHIDFWNPNKLYKGTIVSSGQCIMKVAKVGSNTVYGSLSEDSTTEKRESPLTVKLKDLAKGISKFGYIGAILIVFIILLQKIGFDNNFDSVLISEYFRNYSQFFSDLTEALIMGIIVIVVAVPEGLPLMIAIVCSLNMKKMLKSNVLVRKLNGIETSGSLNVLFCDKTGTITSGKLEANEITLGNSKNITDINTVNKKFKELLKISIINNSSAYFSGTDIIGGNSTEKALLSFIKNSSDIKHIKINKVKENVFNSINKFSSAYITGDYNISLYKGAPEKIIFSCQYYIDENGNKIPFSQKDKFSKILDLYAKNQKRLIALTYSEGECDIKNIPQNLILIGVISLSDKIRYNVRSSVEAVIRAGIQVVMITGDRKETAISVAKEAGILNYDSDIVLTSKELSEYSDDMLKKIFKDIKVIARALPSDKSRLVRIAQELELVSGMTGDGVNDCPALKKADVGFSMGSGTEAAKDAGDIIILDDNFASIKNAILYGRTIYKSIKKFINFQLTINVSAVAISILGPILGIYKPLNISQMLWINLVMDTLAAIAFGGEAALGKYLLEKPKRRAEKIMDKKLWSSVITGGSFITLMSFIFFASSHIHNFFRYSSDDIFFYTGYFSFFIFTCIFNAFNTRCEDIDLLDHLSCNKPFLAIISLIFIMQIIMTYFGGAFLRTEGLIFKEWIIIFILSILIVPADLIRKLIIK